jgi:hypothetical protein
MQIDISSIICVFCLFRMNFIPSILFVGQNSISKNDGFKNREGTIAAMDEISFAQRRKLYESKAFNCRPPFKYHLHQRKLSQ